MKKAYLLLLLQALVITGVIVLLGLAPRPLPTGLIRWDAEWYETVRAHGYVYNAKSMSNTAFFPMFPMVWRATHLGSIGISLLNMLVAGCSLYMLWRGLRLRPAVVVLFAVFPSSLFLYLPYTESFFFFFSSLVILMLAKNYRQPAGLAGALFGGALTRVAAFFYVPALVVMEGVEWLQAPTLSSFWVRLRRLLGYGLATIAGLLTVAVYQWYQTGVWFAFYKAQAQWGHRFGLPYLPFISTTENDGSLWIDGLALLVGVLCVLWLAWIGVRALQRKGPAPDRLLVFSAAYLAATVGQTVLNTSVESGHSSLFSLHRYVFCTPFFLVMLNKLMPQQPLAWRTVALALLVVLLTTATLGVFTDKLYDIEWPTSKIPFLWGPVAGSAYAAFVLGYAFLWLQVGTRWGRLLVYVSSFAIQLFFVYTYAVGHWVG